MTPVSCFFSEFVSTAVLMIAVFALTDKYNNAPPPAVLPIAIFILVLGLVMALGMETGVFISFAFREGADNWPGIAINPARDLGPRLLTSMVGYGKAVYTYRK